MDAEWTDNKTKLLKEILFKKWKSFKATARSTDQDERAWSDFLLKHGIFVMCPRNVRKVWNMGRRSVCIDDPTLDHVRTDSMAIDRSLELLDRDWIEAGTEAWYLVPEELATKILVLGDLPT